MIEIIKEISKRDDVDKNMKIYPGKNNSSDEWYTLQDFLDSANVDNCSLENIKNMIQKQIPDVSNFLLE